MNHAFIHKVTSEIHYHSETGDNPEELPDDIDSEPYVSVPHKNDLDLGQVLVLRFTAESMPQDEMAVRDIFRRSGAYARFKTLLSQRGQLDAWYQFEEAALEEALREWCRAEGLSVDE